VARFRPDGIVVGGSAAHAWPLFGPALSEALAPVECRPSARFGDAALLGAAALMAGVGRVGMMRVVKAAKRA
jgi:hypothetical protein